MLHRRTFDTLTESDSKVLAWQTTVRGGFAVTLDTPGVFSLWLEGWDETLVKHAEYDLRKDTEPYEVQTLKEAITIGEVILSQIVANNV